MSSPLKSIQNKSGASYDSFQNSDAELKLDAEKQKVADVHSDLKMTFNPYFFLLQKVPLFCSPFRRRRKKRKLEETYLTREEAWQMYLNKLDEEANYFTVKEEEDEDICTCYTCIVSEIFGDLF